MTQLGSSATAEPAASPSRQLWLYETVARMAPVSYRSKIMLLVIAGIQVPLLALLVSFALIAKSVVGAVPLICTALAATCFGTALTLALLNKLLRPILITRDAMRAYVAHGRLPALPTGFSDEAGQLMADTMNSLTSLDATLRSLTYVDQVTGLANRDHFLRRLDQRLAERGPMALGIVAVQNMDEILAGFGEPGAVLMLRQAAARLQAVARQDAIIARVDGPHFAVTCSRAPGAPGLEVQARTILGMLNDEIRAGDIRIMPHCAMGIALAPEDAPDARALLNAALTALPMATTTDLAFYTPAAQSCAQRRMSLQHGLRQALEQQAFSLHYQPIVSLAAGAARPRIIGAEALLRWTHPELGPISPGVFIPLAERIGLMDEIGPWILETGCTQLRAWDAAGLPALRLAVNISARQFSDDRLISIITRSLSRFSLPPHRLEVEMTETAALQDRATTRRVFGALRDLGITVAIDDFGTGYSTMSHLRDVPFDTLKIDREFVRDIDSSASGRAICKALIELGRGLDIRVHAEGVERAEEVATLQSYGCEIFQGFYFGRPMTGDAFAQSWLAQAEGRHKPPPRTGGF